MNRRRDSKWTLVSLKGDCRIRLKTGLNTVGRTADNDVVIKELQVSRNHCSIRVHTTDSKLYITDLNSQNGTYLDKSKLIGQREIQIKQNDLIGFGEPVQSTETSKLSFRLERDVGIPVTENRLPNAPTTSRAKMTNNAPNNPKPSNVSKNAKPGCSIIKLNLAIVDPIVISDDDDDVIITNQIIKPNEEAEVVQDLNAASTHEVPNENNDAEDLVDVARVHYEPDTSCIDLCSEEGFWEELPISAVEDPIEDPLANTVINTPKLVSNEKSIIENMPTPKESLDPLALNNVDTEIQTAKETNKERTNKELETNNEKTDLNFNIKHKNNTAKPRIESDSSEEDMVVNKYKRLTKKRQNPINYSSDEKEDVKRKKKNKKDKKEKAHFSENNNKSNRRKSTDKQTKEKETEKNYEHKKEKSVTPESHKTKRKSDNDNDISELSKNKKSKRSSLDSIDDKKEKENQPQQKKPKETIMIEIPSIRRRPIKANIPVIKKSEKTETRTVKPTNDSQITKHIDIKETRKKKLTELALKKQKNTVPEPENVPEEHHTVPAEIITGRNVPKIATKPPLYSSSFQPTTPQTGTENYGECSQAIVDNMTWPSFCTKNTTTGVQPHPVTTVSHMYKQSEAVHDICSWSVGQLEMAVADRRAVQSEITKEALKQVKSLYMTFDDYYATYYPLLLNEIFEIIKLEYVKRGQNTDFNGVIESLNSTTNINSNLCETRQLTVWNCSILISKEEYRHYKHVEKREILEIGDLIKVSQNINNIPVKYFGIICNQPHYIREPTTNLKDLCNQLKHSLNNKYFFQIELICKTQKVMPEPGNKFYCNKIKGLKAQLHLCEAIKKVNDSSLKSFILNPFTFPLKPQKNLSVAFNPKFRMSKAQANIAHSIMTSIYEDEPSLSLICGPPASGKTRLIAGLILQILEQENLASSERRPKKILICSYSVAVLDTITSYLLAIEDSSANVVILGPSSRHERLILQKQAERQKIRINSEKDQKLIEKSIFLNANVIVSTFAHCFDSNVADYLYPTGVNDTDHFLCCIIDGASGSTEPELLVPLLHNIKNFVMVDDQNLFTPRVLSKVAIEYGLQSSIFSRCQSIWQKRLTAPYYELNEVFKMDPEIAKFPLATFYENKSITVRKPISSTDLFNPYNVIDHNFSNNDYQKEAQLVIDLLIELYQQPAFQRLKIFVIAEGILLKLLAEKMKETEGLMDKTGPSVLDHSMGKQRDVIILCNKSHNLKLALTRAAKCLIILNNFSSVSAGSPWSNLLLDSIRRNMYLKINEDTEPTELIEFITKKKFYGS